MIQQYNFIQQPHIFNSVTNSVVLSNFTVLSHYTVPHIQLYYLISQSNSFNSPTYSIVSQIQLNYLISHLIQQTHTFNSVTNSTILSRFTFSSHSTVPYIQPCDKFNYFISFYILISFNSPTYSKVQQSQ